MTTRAAKPQTDSALAHGITREVAKRVVGQEVMVERLLVGLLTGGHILLEGVPGLAKTLAVRTVAECLRIAFSRIQFTPDLLPADVIGTMVFDQRSQEFYPKKGRCSPTSCWRTRSIARRPRCSPRCSRRCRKSR
jgi:MoxR-like ATPase